MSVNNSTKARSKEMEDSSVRFLYYTQIDTISLKGRQQVKDINPKAVAKITKHRFIPNKLTKEIIWTHKNIQLL